jgi:hypothetical protein
VRVTHDASIAELEHELAAKVGQIQHVQNSNRGASGSLGSRTNPRRGFPSSFRVTLLNTGNLLRFWSGRCTRPSDWKTFLSQHSEGAAWSLHLTLLNCWAAKRTAQ